MADEPDPTTSWTDWHHAYADPASPLSQRLAVVVARIREALDLLPGGPLRLISVCAGQGHDVVGALAGHPRADDVTGRLVEADPTNAGLAHAALQGAGLDRIEVVCADAAVTTAYDGAAPADLLLLCGVFGNVTDDDVRTTVTTARMLCAAGGVVLWTRHRRAPDLTPTIRGWFDEAGFDELAFDSPGPDSYSVGMHRSREEPVALAPVRMFAFVR